MVSVDEDVAALRSRVSIISTIDCPQVEPFNVKVLSIQGGVEQLTEIPVTLPTYFDRICTVVVDEVTSPPAAALPLIRSSKDVLRWLRSKMRVVEKTFGRRLQFEQPIFDLRSINPNNIAHLLTEIVPLCLHARRSVDREIAVVLSDLNRDFATRARELLAAFAIEPVVSHKKIAGPHVHVRGMRGMAVYDLKDTFDCPPLLYCPEPYRGCRFKKTIHYEKVFFSRRGLRSLLNGRDVERMLEAQGYTTVYMEDFSIADQISIGANARNVVAIHGAAMGYLTLNRNIESVIELSPPHVYHSLFPLAMRGCVQKYIIVIPDFDAHVIHNGWPTILHFKNKRFEVNTALLERALAEVADPNHADM